MTKKLSFRTWILILGAFYFSGSLIQNLLAVKMLGTSTFTFCDSGLLISWLVFACMDIVTETMGKRSAVTYFTIASGLNLFFSLVYMLVIALPGVDAVMSDSFANVFGTNWRIVISSVTAFWVGNYINAGIMYTMRVKAKNENSKAGFIARAIISTLFGQLVDNFLFNTMAFGPFGIPGTYEMPWIAIIQMVAFGTFMETVSEATFSPLTVMAVNRLKKLRDGEGIKIID